MGGGRNVQAASIPDRLSDLGWIVEFALFPGVASFGQDFFGFVDVFRIRFDGRVVPEFVRRGDDRTTSISQSG